MRKVAQLKFEDKFTITNKGLVIAGQLIDGEVAAGNSIYIDDNTSIRILSVEHGRLTNHSFVGLVVGVILYPEKELEKLVGQTLVIIK